MIGVDAGAGTQTANARAVADKEVVVVLEPIEVRGIREATVASTTGTPTEAKGGTVPIGTGPENFYPVSAAASKSVSSEGTNFSSEQGPPRKQ
jgi:hypothetical protein